MAGRRWGAGVAGVVIAVPIVAGPILAILTIDHGRAFGAAAARGALLGVVALSAFCVVYAASAAAGWTSPRALAVGWLAYAAVAVLASRFEVPPGWGLLIALTALAAGYLLIGEQGVIERPDRPPPAWDLPARAGLTAVLVIALTGAGGALGPTVSGVLTPFPVATSVIAVFALRQDVPVATRAMLRGFVRSLPGFALCFFAVAIAL